MLGAIARKDSSALITFGNGEIAMGSAIGGLQLVDGQPYSLPFYFSEGSLGITVKNIPLIANYYISDLGFKGGRANRFNVRFDAATYYRNRIRQLKMNEDLLQINIDSLRIEKQHIAKRIAFLSMNLPSKDSLLANTPKITNSLPDSIIGTMPELSMDTLSLPPLQLPNTSAIEKNKSIEDLKSEYNQLTETITKYEALIQRQNQLKELNLEGHGKFGNKLRLQKLKQFQIGNSTPYISELTVANTRILGVHIASESTRLHLEAAAGWLSPQYPSLYTPADLLPQNKLRNMFDGRSGNILFGRFGYGTLVGSHILFSGLTGKDNFNNGFQTTDEKRTSANVEADGQIAHKVFRINFKLARRIVSNKENSNSDVYTPSVNELNFVSGEGLFISEFKKAQTTFETKYRWVGPQYFTVGNPFLRSDNSNLQTRLTNSSWKYIQPSAFFNFSKNDVLNQFSYSNTLHYSGIELSSRPWQCLQIRAMYAPALMSATNNDVHIETQTNLYNGSISFNKALKNVQWLTQIAANRTAQIWDSLNFVSTSAQASITITVSEKFSLTGLYQQASITGIEEPIEYSMGSIMTQCNLNHGWQIQGSLNSCIVRSVMNFGGSFSIRKTLGRHFAFSLNAEKFVNPLLSNSTAPEGSNLPYFFQSKIAYLLTK
ncbi:MAG: hypothetical protein ACKVOK_12620 [Flavobacteriales bacterium]